MRTLAALLILSAFVANAAAQAPALEELAGPFADCQQHRQVKVQGEGRGVTTYDPGWANCAAIEGEHAKATWQRFQELKKKQLQAAADAAAAPAPLDPELERAVEAEAENSRQTMLGVAAKLAPH
jgi:hypothetical protein